MSSKERIFLFCLILLTIFRLLNPLYQFNIANENVFHDFFGFLKFSKDFILGINPYSPIGEGNLNIPNTSLFFIPFIYMNKKIAANFFYFLNIILVFISVRKILISSSIEKVKFTTYEIAAVLLLLNNAFIRSSLFFGQITIFAVFLLIYSLTSSSRYVRGFFFGALLSIKYSLAPIYILLMFFYFRWKEVIISVITFLFFLFLSLIYFDDPIKIIIDYIKNFSLNLTSTNRLNYEEQIYLVHLSFIKNQILRITIILTLLIFSFFILYREVKKSRKKISYDALFFLSCVNIVILYHRPYDLVFNSIILSILFFHDLFKKLKVKLLAFFVVLFTLPYFLIEKTSIFLGNFLKETFINNYISIAERNEDVNFFPLPALIVLILSLYALVRYFSKKNDRLYLILE